MNRHGAPLVLGLVTLLALGACARSESAPTAQAARPMDESSKAASGPSPGSEPIRPEGVAPEPPQAPAAPLSPPASGKGTVQPRPDSNERKLDAPSATSPSNKPSGGLSGSSSHGTVSAGEAQVTGGLSPELIHSTVKQNFDKIRACYETGLHANPALQGRVTVKLVIGTNGTTKSAVPSQGDFPDKAVVDCIGRAFNAIRFPPPTRGEVTVNYPVLLSPST